MWYSEIDEFIDGCRRSKTGPDDELVRRVRAPDGDRFVTFGKLAKSFDFGRYVPTVGSKTGMVTLCWRTDTPTPFWRNV